MFKKKYFVCYEERFGKKNYKNFYSCKKFDKFLNADTFSCIFHNTQIIEVYNNIPEFLIPFYLQYKITKSKFICKIDIEP